MANEKRLIDANAIPWEEYYVPDPDSNAQWDFKKEWSVAKPVIDQMPTVDAVSRGVHDQVRWERDIAMEQLEEHGIPFGGIAPDVVKVVRCKDCKHGIWDEDEQMWECILSVDLTGDPDTYAMFHEYNDGEHFCSYGERKDNDN